MREEYDINALNPRENPYASKLKKQITKVTSHPNAKTLASMEEVEAMISGEIPKRTQSVSEFAKEMGE